jgi:uncharacterized membrane protein
MLTLPRPLSLFVVLVAACSSHELGAPPARDVTEVVRYHVEEIPAPEGYGSTTPGGINRAGIIAGSLDGRPDTTFIHRPGVTQVLNVFDEVSEASAINARGDIVGTRMQPGRLDTFKPFQWLNGDLHPVDLMTVLPETAVDGVGSDINEAQVVVGTFEIRAAGLKPHPFVYDNATREVTVLHPPGATYAYGTAINSANQVVGHLWGVSGVGFVYDLPSGEYSPLTFEPEAINAFGLIVGNRDGATPIVKELGGSDVLLPTFGTSFCRALAVNNAGVIVGTASPPAATTNDDVVAVSFESGEVVNLNQRLADGAGWHVIAAHDINDAGVIVGLALRVDDPGRRLRGVRLVPVTAP